MVKTDNHYLKTILGKVTGKTVKGVKNNNQLLKEISEKIGQGGGGTPIDLSDYYDKSETDALLSLKLDSEDAFSGSYNDLTNKPSIPVKTSDLTNDSGFLTSHQDITGKMNKTDYETKNVVVTYTDETTATLKFVVEK